MRWMSKAGTLKSQDEQIKSKDKQIKSQDEELSSLAEKLAKQQETLEAQQKKLKEQQKKLSSQKKKLSSQQDTLKEQQSALDEKTELLEEQQEKIDKIIGVKAEVVEALQKEFEKKNLNVDIDPQTGALTLNANVMFDYDQAELTDSGRMSIVYGHCRHIVRYCWMIPIRNILARSLLMVIRIQTEITVITWSCHRRGLWR